MKSSIGKKLKASERRVLENALCALVDHNGIIADALGEIGEHEHAIHVVCRGLRLIVDGEE